MMETKYIIMISVGVAILVSVLYFLLRKPVPPPIPIIPIIPIIPPIPFSRIYIPMPGLFPKRVRSDASWAVSHTQNDCTKKDCDDNPNCNAYEAGSVNICFLDTIENIEKDGFFDGVPSTTYFRRAQYVYKKRYQLMSIYFILNFPIIRFILSYK